MIFTSIGIGTGVVSFFGSLNRRGLWFGLTMIAAAWGAKQASTGTSKCCHYPAASGTLEERELDAAAKLRDEEAKS